MGDIDDDQIREHILQLDIEAANIVGLLELFDVRNILSSDKVSVSGLVHLGQKHPMVMPRNKTGKLAILVSNPLHYGLARAFLTFAVEDGGSAAIFYDYDDALEFLGLQSVKDDVTILINSMMEDHPPA